MTFDIQNYPIIMHTERQKNNVYSLLTTIIFSKINDETRNHQKTFLHSRKEHHQSVFKWFGRVTMSKYFEKPSEKPILMPKLKAITTQVNRLPFQIENNPLKEIHELKNK